MTSHRTALHTCGSGVMVVSPDETVDVTFATHVEVGDYVQTLDLWGYSVTLTLDPSGNEIRRSYWQMGVNPAIRRPGDNTLPAQSHA